MNTISKLSKHCLSERQREVLELSTEGLNRRQIAKSLGVAEYTVAEHLKTAYKKLEATNRTEAVATAMARGLLRLEQFRHRDTCPRCGLHLQPAL